MFVFGLLLGITLVVLVLICLAHQADQSKPVIAYRARQTIWDIERRTIHEMLAAELAAQRAAALGEVIDGSAEEPS